MKKSIVAFIIALLVGYCCMQCKGQYNPHPNHPYQPDTIYLEDLHDIGANEPDTSVWWDYLANDTIVFCYKYDTIPAILLVCDTASFYSGDVTLRNPQVFWIHGYVVFPDSNWGRGDCSIYGSFLDVGGDALDKNIVVWDFKLKE